MIKDHDILVNCGSLASRWKDHFVRRKGCQGQKNVAPVLKCISGQLQHGRPTRHHMIGRLSPCETRYRLEVEHANLHMKKFQLQVRLHKNLI